jgi:hypothetical protein
MPDFDVGNAELQELLKWVDQPPPQQGRDTHALRFQLQRVPTSLGGLHYMGLLFYRPGNPTSGPFQLLPGLSGVATKLLHRPNCNLTSPPVGLPAQENVDHDYVLVEVRFKPPRAFVGLQFCRGRGFFGGLLGPVIRSMDASPVEISSDPPSLTASMTMSSDAGSWSVHSLQKTTVLFSPM